jgi:GST-like protein
VNDEYTPPPVWTWNKETAAASPTSTGPSPADPRHGAAVGRHPLQLYSLGTPNGVKVTVMLEELLALGQPAPSTTPG